MADEPSPSQLEWLITRNHAETSADIVDLKTQLTTQAAALFNRFAEHVLIKVYEADERARHAERDADRQRIQVERDADRQRIQRLEEERAEIRRGNRTALLGGVVAVIAAIATVVIDQLTKG